MTQTPRPFKVEVPDAVLSELRRKLESARLPGAFDAQSKDPIRYGVNVPLVSMLREYWLNGYDWRKHEAELNTFRQFKLSVEGLDVHFIHERSKVPGAVPLLLLHGWPGSVWEFHKLIPQLVQPTGRPLRLKQAFHVVAPSLPGYGWSEEARTPGMDPARIARMLDKLMLDLGYDRYVAQGGDWGAVIAKTLAITVPEHCVALHVNLVVNRLPVDVSLRSAALAANMLVDLSPLGALTLSERDRNALHRLKEYQTGGSGYFRIQATKPMTLAFGLADSPVGLLAWILEKMQAWTDGAGNVLNVLSKDEILTNVMIYYVTNTIASSMRLYYEMAKSPARSQLVSSYVEVPTAVASFPKEILMVPRRWIALGFNLVRFTEFPEGGHFAAWEQPDMLAQDLRGFFFKTITFEHACKLAQQRRARRDDHVSTDTLVGSVLLLAPALPLPVVVGVAAYVLGAKL